MRTIDPLQELDILLDEPPLEKPDDTEWSKAYQRGFLDGYRYALMLLKHTIKEKEKQSAAEN